LHAFKHSHFAVDLDVCAQAHQLVDVHEAVFKNGFGHLRCALGNRVQHHELRLHVGGEAWVFGGAEVLRLEVFIRRRSALDANALCVGSDCCTCIAQLVDDRVQMIGTGVAQKHVAASGSHCTQKRTSLNAVSHHFVGAAVQTLHTLDVDAACAVAFNLRAHGNEHFGQVWNLWLLRGVFQHGFTVGQRCSHEEVFCASDGHHVGGNACAFEACATTAQFGNHVAVVHINLCTHGLQAFQVLIHRA